MEVAGSEARSSGYTAEQIDELAEALRRMITRHRQRQRAHQEAFRALTYHDRASAESRAQLRNAAAAESRICRAASSALDALTEGRFGFCSRCGVHISIEHLRARLPYELCVACS